MKVIDEECIFDRSEDDPDVLRVRGTGEVCVKGFLAIAVLILVHLQDELFRRLAVAPRPCGDESGHNERESVFFSREIT